MIYCLDVFDDLIMSLLTSLIPKLSGNIKNICPGCHCSGFLFYSKEPLYELEINSKMIKGKLSCKNEEHLKIYDTVVKSPMCRICRTNTIKMFEQMFDLFVEINAGKAHILWRRFFVKNQYDVYEETDISCTTYIRSEPFDSYLDMQLSNAISVNIRYDRLCRTPNMTDISMFTYFPIRTEDIVIDYVKLRLRNMFLKELVTMNSTNKDEKLSAEYQLLITIFPSDVSVLILLFE